MQEDISLEKLIEAKDAAEQLDRDAANRQAQRKRDELKKAYREALTEQVAVRCRDRAAGRRRADPSHACDGPDARRARRGAAGFARHHRARHQGARRGRHVRLRAPASGRGAWAGRRRSSTRATPTPR